MGTYEPTPLDRAAHAAIESHEGWANRETWAVALHINNDQGWQESVHEALRGRDADLREHCADRLAPYEAGEIIRENVDETLDLLWEASGEPGRRDEIRAVIDDLGSLWRVDWTELGAAFLADLQDE